MELVFLLAAVACVAFLPPAARGAHRGERVRLRYKLGQRVEGKIVDLDPDRVAIEQSQADTLIYIPAASIIRVERYAGERRYGWFGLVTGAVFGGVIGWNMKVESNEFLGGHDGFEKAVYGTLIGGTLGAVIGHAIRTDVWERMPVWYLRASATPGQDGMRLTVTVRWP